MGRIKIYDNNVKIKDLVQYLDFEVINEGDFNIQITDPNIYQTGYEMAGYFVNEENIYNHIHIYGKRESNYLSYLTSEKRDEIFKEYFSCDFPALIISNDGEIYPEILENAKKYNKNILRSKLDTSATIREMKFFLSKELAKEQMIDGYILMEILGIGVLLTGYEDAKLGVTIELLERGHKLITDNHLILKRIAENDLEGYNRTDKTMMDSHFFLDNPKDGSKIDITTIFGIKATRKMKRIDILIELENWNEKKFYDRLGLDTVYQEFLGEKIPKLTLPVRKGRNLAIIVETAALNYRLKRMGVNSAEFFMKESQKLILKNRKKQGENMKNEKKLSIQKLKNNFSLEIITGEKFLEERYIQSTNIYRPSLALAGYLEDYKTQLYRGVQIFSKSEFDFLNTLPKEERERNLKNYLEYNFPLLVLTQDAEPPKYFIDMIREKNLILARSSYKKTAQLIAKFNSFLETFFTSDISVHGVFLEMYGFGVLLTGKSGIGKSETALELIHRKHRLIADDLVKFVKDTHGDIVGSAGDLPYFMEIRGLGIIDIKTLYGLGSVRINKKLDIVIELKEQESSTDYLSTVGYKSNEMEILGEKIPKIELYISSGRNAAAMTEIAVMNMMATTLGHNPEKLYKEGIKRMTEEEKFALGVCDEK